MTLTSDLGSSADIEASPQAKGWTVEYLALVTLIAVTFGQALEHRLLLWWDDTSLIWNNVYVAPPSLKMAVAAWWHVHEGLYIPVTYTFWMLVTTIPMMFGYPKGWDAMPFHAANLLVHAFNAILVLRLLKRLLPEAKPFSLFAAAAVFAIHPLQTEAVCWASSMKDLLSTAMVLLACFSYLNSRDASQSRTAWYLLSLLLGWFAVLCKPSAVIVGPFLLVIECVLRRRPVWGTVLRVLPFLLMGILPAMWTHDAQASQAMQGLSWTYRPQIAAYSLCHYLRQVAWPGCFCADYGESPLYIIMGGWGPWCCLILAVGLLATPCLPSTARRIVIAGLGLFIAGVAPVLGLVGFGFQRISTTGDRYAYASMIGVAFVLAYFLTRMPRKAALATTALLLGALGTLSIRQAGYWRDDLVLMTRAVEINPDSMAAYANLAVTDQPYIFCEAMSRKAAIHNLHGEIATLSQMRFMCRRRGDYASASWYAHLLLTSEVLRNSDARAIAMDAIEFAQDAMQAGDTLRAAKFLAVAGRFRPDLPSYRNTCADLEKLRSQPQASP
jgi:hypothetical protein